MSKTFKSALDSPVTLEVEDASDVPGVPGVYLTVSQSTTSQSTILLAPSDASALALAILEAAGYTEAEYVDEWPNVNRAVFSLRLGIEEQEREASRAKEQAELEAEALELCNSYRNASDMKAISSFEGYATLRAHWLAVARKAREIAKETSNA